MRGNPLWQLVLVVVAFAAMALPVWRLTRPAQAAGPAGSASSETKEVGPADSAEAEAVTLEITADFAPAPAEFSLSYLGEAVLQAKGQATVSGTWKAQIPTEGADLVLHAVWPTEGVGGSGGGSRALRIKLRWPDGRELEKNFWTRAGEGLDTVLTVPGGVAGTTRVP